MRVIIENSAMLNGGDAAIHAATLRLVKLAFGEDTEVLFSDQKADVAERLYPELEIFPQVTSSIARRFPFRVLARLMRGRSPYPAFRIMLAVYETLARIAPALVPEVIRNGLRTAATADLRLASGGTYISSHYGAARVAVEFDKRATRGVPLGFMTQTIESTVPDSAFAHLGRTMAQAPLILLRDPESAELVKTLAGPEARTQVVPDAAFVLADTDRLAARAEAPQLSTRPRVAISVRTWRFFKTRSSAEGMASYTAAIQRMACDLVRDWNAEVVFVSTCQGVPDYEYDDSDVAREMVAGLPEDVAAQVTVDAAFRKPEALLSTLEGIDAVISTRMHMAILSLCKGVPVLPIAYERKTADLFGGMGMGDLLLDIEDITPEAASEKVALLMGDLAGWQGKAARATLDLHAQAMTTVDHLRAAFPKG